MKHPRLSLVLLSLILPVIASAQMVRPTPDLTTKYNRAGVSYDAAQNTRPFAEEANAVKGTLLDGSYSLNAYDVYLQGVQRLAGDGSIYMDSGAVLDYDGFGSGVLTDASGFITLTVNRVVTINPLADSYGLFIGSTIPLSVTNYGLYADSGGDLWWGKSGAWEKVNASYSVGPVALGPPVSITGDADEIEFTITGNATQTSDLMRVETSAAVSLFTLDNSGNESIRGGLTVSDAGGSSTLDSTGLTVGTGLSVDSGGGEFSLDGNGLEIQNSSSIGFADARFIRSGTELLELVDATTGGARLRFDDGSAASPAILLHSASGDAGVYNIGGEFRISAGGVEAVTVDSALDMTVAGSIAIGNNEKVTGASGLAYWKADSTYGSVLGYSTSGALVCGGSVFDVYSGVPGGGGTVGLRFRGNNGQVTTRSDGYYAFSSTTTVPGTPDLLLERGGAGELKVDDGTNAVGLAVSASGVAQVTDGAGSAGSLIVGGAAQLQLEDDGTKPTCDSSSRGTIWYDAGGAGVADTVEICGKSAADSYSWVALATF